MKTDTMTFGETFAAIRQGDVGCIKAFALECAIMASPFVIIIGAWLAR